MYLEVWLLHPLAALDREGLASFKYRLESRIRVINVIRAHCPPHLLTTRPKSTSYLINVNAPYRSGMCCVR